MTDDPRLQSKLQEISDNPVYYSRWTLRQIEGNMDVNGSSASEANHSSLQSFLQKYGCFDIKMLVVKLFDRQVDQHKQRAQARNKIRSNRRGFTSTLHGDWAASDKEAHDYLSSYFYRNHFVRACSRAQGMQARLVDQTVQVCSRDLNWESAAACQKLITSRKSTAIYQWLCTL